MKTIKIPRHQQLPLRDLYERWILIAQQIDRRVREIARGYKLDPQAIDYNIIKMEIYESAAKPTAQSTGNAKADSTQAVGQKSQGHKN